MCRVVFLTTVCVQSDKIYHNDYDYTTQARLRQAKMRKNSNKLYARVRERARRQKADKKRMSKKEREWGREGQKIFSENV